MPPKTPLSPRMKGSAAPRAVSPRRDAPPRLTLPRRESATDRRARVSALIARFRRTYPDAHCELDFRTPLELLVATILSAQCTDKRVNLVTPALFRRCPTARDYAEIPTDELEKLIQSTGFFRAKSRSIRSCGAGLVADHGGEIPRSMEELTALAGVGRKTANVVLGNAFGINLGIVVDTHVQRLSTRLGLTRELLPEKIEQDLMKLVPREQWTLFSHWLIWHGRRRCTARNPDCPGCEVADLCPSAGKVGKLAGKESAEVIRGRGVTATAAARGRTSNVER